jgi:hypothetical protein
VTRQRQDEPRRPGPAQAARGAYQPAPGAQLLACALPGCGAKYFDDQPGRDAHRAVFGHQPKAPSQQRPAPKEDSDG